MNFATDSVEETMRMHQVCKMVSTPTWDPVHGANGPMATLWKTEKA
jgi:uncharacterized protein YjlB